jgi:hypothetical protein
MIFASANLNLFCQYSPAGTKTFAAGAAGALQRSQLVLVVCAGVGDTAGAGVKFSTSLLTIRPFSPEPLCVN